MFSTLNFHCDGCIETKLNQNKHLMVQIQTYWCLLVHPVLAVSLDSILQDLHVLERGMEVTRREFCAEEENPVLQTFLSSNAELLHSLTADGKTAQVTAG